MNIGIIGGGLMGHGIASNLLKHGHALRLVNRPGNQPVDDLLGLYHLDGRLQSFDSGHLPAPAMRF